MKRCMLLLHCFAFFSLFTVAWGDERSSRKIVGFKFKGVEAGFIADIENKLPIEKKDEWRPQLRERVIQMVKDYYNLRGFPQATVDVFWSLNESNEGILNIEVNPNQHYVLKSVWFPDPPGFKTKHMMKRFRRKMEKILGLDVPQRYDEKIVADRLRRLKEFLQDEGYILANTDLIETQYSPQDYTVDVRLKLIYGDRVSFGYQGNTVFTQGELNEIVTKARATGLGKDYVDMISRKFQEAYQKKAYLNVKIENRIQEEAEFKHVTFFIAEGVRARYESIAWEGLSAGNQKLAQKVFEESASRLVQRGYYVEEDIDKAVDVVLEELKANGYLLAALKNKNILILKSSDKQHLLKLSFYFQEGEQTIIESIEFQGNSFYSNDGLLDFFKLREGMPFNPFLFEERLQALKQRYRNEGFFDFEVLTPDSKIVRYSEDVRSVSIKIQVNEGTRYRMGEIHVEGLNLTKPFVVDREIHLKPDEFWLNGKIEETELNLRRLGIFSDVKIYPIQSNRGEQYRDVMIQLTEAQPGSLEIGPGFRSDLGLRAFANVSYNNILGRNWIGSLSVQGNRRFGPDYRFIEYNLETNFIEPRFLGTKNLYAVGLSTRLQRFPPDFNAETTQFRTGFERRLNKYLGSRFYYHLERIRQFDVYYGGVLQPEDNRTMLIGSLIPALTFDSRDSPFTTTKGWLVSLSFERAHPYFSGQPDSDENAPSYQKWNFSIKRYIPITNDIVWSNVIATGFAQSKAAGQKIPLIKMYRLGGYSTIRGYAEDSINVDAADITGSLTSVNLRTQIDLPFAGDLRVAPFLDAGNLYINGFRERPLFKAGAGFGFHYMTPIGPINLDWGYKLKPQAHESPSQFHFSVGMI